MDILAGTVCNITDRTVVSTCHSSRDQNDNDNAEIGESFFKHMFSICKNRKCLGSCLVGILLSVIGTTCLIIYLTSHDHAMLLVPALGFVISGISLSIVGEWYCKRKIQDLYFREVGESGSRRGELSNQEIQRIAGIIYRIPNEGQTTGNPPNYYTVYPRPDQMRPSSVHIEIDAHREEEALPSYASVVTVSGNTVPPDHMLPKYNEISEEKIESS